MPSLRDDILSKTKIQEQMLYLKTLFEEAQTNLGEDGGADELIPALVEYFKKKYHPEALTPETLLDVYQYLYAWRPNGIEMDAYIFASVQGALLHIISEPLKEPLNKPLELMHTECLEYIAALRQQLKKNPHNKRTKKQMHIVSAANEILQDEYDSNPTKATLFCKIIAENEAIFTQEQHPRTMLFLKAVAVFMAFCIGAGIGGVVAYQKLFNQNNEEKTKEKPFRLLMFQPSPDNSPKLEEEKEKEKENKDIPDGSSAT